MIIFEAIAFVTVCYFFGPLWAVGFLVASIFVGAIVGFHKVLAK